MLVDDVLFSGRTIRAALDALNDIGRPNGRAARGPGRPRPPGASDPRRLRRQEPAHLAGRAGPVTLAGVDDVDAVTIEGTGSAVKRHLLSAADLTRDDAELVLTTAEEMRVPGGPADQEAARAARPHRGQPLLRGLHPHPDLLRGRRQAADAPTSSTSPPRARACRKGESLKDTALTLEAMGADAVVVRHGASGAPHRLAHSGWVRSSVVNAGDGTHEHPTQALLDAFTMWKHLGSPSPAASRAGGSRSSATCCTAGSRAPTRCCCRPWASRSRWWRRRPCCRSASRPGRSRRRTTSTRAAQGRRGDDAAGPAGADERRRSSRPRGSTRAATASTASGWRRSGPHDRDAPRADGPRHGDHRRRRRLRPLGDRRAGHQRRRGTDGGAVPAARRCEPAVGGEE